MTRSRPPRSPHPPGKQAGKQAGRHRPAKAPAAERRAAPAKPTPPERRPGPGPSLVREARGPWLYGQHAVLAALANPRRTIRRLLATEEAGQDLPPGLEVRTERVDRRALDQLLPGAVHQGLAVLADPLPDPSLDDLIAATDQDSLFLVLDQVTDPHNVGAILRSAAAFGAAAVIVQERHSPPVTGTLAKAASGATELVALCRVVNLARALRDLKDAGVRTVGLDSEAGLSLAEALAPGPLALVLGAEGQGLRRLVAETCDALARLPTRPPLASLNVSNAAAIALYAARQRG
jgi:23S rRNA (guanosine2251-2'-O)-methyltransferase